MEAVYRETGAKRVQTLINTHWHPEQTGSNERLAKAGTKIIAHENTSCGSSTRRPEPGQAEPYGPLPAEGSPERNTRLERRPES